MGEVVNGVVLSTLTTEESLYKLLDATEDFDERKKVRNRLRQVVAEQRVQRDEAMKKREEEREQMIQQRKKEAEEQKRRTLAMYDHMSKSAPGPQKVMDINIYKNAEPSPAQELPVLQTRDLVEEGIQQRHQEAEDRKRKVLAAYDATSKSRVAGPKTPDFNAINGSTSASPAQELPVVQPRDFVEEGIQQRHQEAEERKRKVLAAYDVASKSGVPGPKTPDFNAINGSTSAPVTPVVKKPPGDCTFGSILPKQIEPQPSNNQKLSAKDRFQQMDAVQNKHTPSGRPNFRGGRGNMVTRSASDIKDMLLHWCKSKTKEYEKVDICNFSTAWNDGIAFCALIHHYYPDAFDFESLNPKNRRYNFDLAFRVAEEKADIAPLLDVEDMVLMKKPDWKCVFTYVQSLYRKLHDKD